MVRKSGSQGILIGYEQVMRKIDTAFANRIHYVRFAFNQTGKEMLLDFRGVQYSAPKVDTMTKSQDEDAANDNVAKAIAYANAHSSNVTTNRGIPWINRSFRSGRGVNAIVNGDMKEISLRLSHGIYYGAYLEYAHNRKFAVLEPLIRQYAPRLIANVKRIMGGSAV